MRKVVSGILWGAGVAVLLGVAARIATAPAIATPPVFAPDTYGDHFLRLAWTVAAPGAADFSLSPDGGTAAWTDVTGRIRRINTGTGKTLWRTSPLAGVNRVVAGNTGDVAAFSGLNPQRNSLVLLDAKVGDKKTRVFAGDGAVWSAAFAGGTAFVGTGGRAVYAVRGAPEKPLFRTRGIPDGFAVSADGSRLAFATWSPPAVSGCDAAGRETPWRYKDEPGRRLRVSVSADGRRVTVLSTRGAGGESPVLRVHDADTGKVLWQTALPADAGEASATMSADGNTVAATYCRVADNGITDWRLAYFNAAGQRLFADKGSALFEPHIIAVSPTGNTLTVQDGDATFFTLDRGGNFVSRLRLRPATPDGKPVRVLRVLSSDDGKTILLQQTGDKLTLLRAGS